MSAQVERKRPWYLVAALLGALAFGIGGGCDGFDTVAIYRDGSVDPSGAFSSVGNDADRARLSDLADRYLATMDAAKGRAFPLAVAALIIGVAVVFFTLRAMAGRAEARMVLVQLIAVQAILTGVGYGLQKDVRAVDIEYRAAKLEITARDGEARDTLTRIAVDTEKWLPPFQLAVRAFGAIFIVVALTRRRSREFFNAAGRSPAAEP